jgi:hypothetical protein
MTNILTAAEAANFVRTDTSDAVMLMLLPVVDDVVKHATGRDWTADQTISPIAKAAAGMLLVQYYDNPADRRMRRPDLVSAMSWQLEAEALKYRKYQFYGISMAGGIALPGARVGDDVISLVGVYGVTETRHQSSRAKSPSVELYSKLTAAISRKISMAILKSPVDDVVP